MPGGCSASSSTNPVSLAAGLAVVLSSLNHTRDGIVSTSQINLERQRVRLFFVEDFVAYS